MSEPSPTEPTVPVPLVRAVVRPEWIDVNGHMTNSAYVVAFDDAIFAYLALVGIDDTHRARRKGSTFALELHTTYLREMPPESPYLITGRMLAADAKKIHFWYELRHGEEGWLSATLEGVNMYMDMSIRRPAPFPEDISPRIAAHVEASSRLPWPELAGGTVGLRRR